MYRHLLVPLDGSELGTGLATQAVAFAAALGAKITFFTMREDYGASGEGALARTLSPQAFAELAMGEANAILAKAVAAAGAAGVDCDGVARTGARPYELILDVAAERGCDLIYMASHGRRGVRALIIGSQTQKVLAHATLPVLVATVEANVRGTPAAAAVDIIKDEHRAIAAICAGLREQAARLRAGAETDHELTGALLHYLRAFPERLHHPKEEQYLFARLGQRSTDAGPLITDLEREHAEGGRRLAGLEQAVARLREAGGDAEARTRLGDDIDDFVAGQWRHLNTEEKLLLPLAARHLRDEDWAEIARAFRENAELGKAGAQDEAFRRLFSRLMNQRAGRPAY